MAIVKWCNIVSLSICILTISKAADKEVVTEAFVTKGLLVDLDANEGIETEDGERIKSWSNKIKGKGGESFVKQDIGRKVKGSGRPTLKKKNDLIGGHNTLIFNEQELVNMDEDTFDHLITGNGYTWISVMCVYKQIKGKPNVNSFLGNLRNGSPFEGFWGNLMDDNRLWMGSRNGVLNKKDKKKKRSLWDPETNPHVVSPEPLKENQYYVLAGRMGSGQGKVALDLFINSANAVDSKLVPVNPKANSSKLVIGQERDATNHPGKESFSGEIARILIYERPLSDNELKNVIESFIKKYKIQTTKE